MIRLILIEIALFFLPFFIYGLYLFLRRKKGIFAPAPDTISVLPKPYGLLCLLGLALVALSLVVLALFSGGKPGDVYRPSHYEDGSLVPGGFEKSETPASQQTTDSASGNASGTTQ